MSLTVLLSKSARGLFCSVLSFEAGSHSTWPATHFVAWDGLKAMVILLPQLL